MINVLFAPYGEENPYNNLLNNAVSSEGVRTYKCKINTGLGSYSEIIGLLFPLLRYVFSRDIDVIHVGWTHPFFITAEFSRYHYINKAITLLRAFILILNIFISKLLRLKIVWTVHNKYNHEKHHVKIDVFVSRLFSSLCDAITVECNQAKQTIVDLFHISDQSKIWIIPEGNYITAYENTVGRRTARAKINIPNTEFLFVYFGMIRPYKGVESLIETFGEMDIEATLLIVGSPMNDDIRSRVLRSSSQYENVRTILEYVPNDEIQYYMNAADVVTLPHQDILSSGSVLLAISFGRPIVAPSMGCIPEVVREEKNFLYDPTSADGLTNALTNARYASDLETLGAQNKEKAESLSWDEIGKTTTELYQSIQNCS